MEYENILDEKVKVKGKYTIPLVILAILIVALVGVGCYLYFKSSDPKTVYTSIIDEVSNSVLELLDDISGENDGTRGYDYGFTFDLDSNNQEFEEVANILNKIKLDFGVALDMNAKKANINLETSYKNENMINADIFVNNNVMYGDLNDLYDKPIKISNSEIEQIWETINYEDYKIIVREFTNILKDNLKDEYFTSGKENIEVLGKKVNVNKNTFKLTDVTLKELLDNVFSDMKSNDKLVSALASITGLSKEEVKDEILNGNEDFIVEKNEYIIDIYQKRMDIVKVVIDINGEQLVVNEVKEDEYEVSIIDNDESNVIATFTLKDDKFNLLFNYQENEEEVVIELIVSDEEFLIKTDVTEGILELKMNSVSDTLVDGYFRINSIEEDMDLRIDFTVEDKNVQEIVDMDITNYIDLNSMTDEDYNKLMLNLTENDAVMSLVQDILAIDSFSSLMTY